MYNTSLLKLVYGAALEPEEKVRVQTINDDEKVFC